MDEERTQDAPGAEAAATAPRGRTAYRLDTSQMKSSYCNASNVLATREEFVLNFGLNESWDLGRKDFPVDLHHRIILNPVAAKRLQQTLGKLLQDYEARYGPLS